MLEASMLFSQTWEAATLSHLPSERYLQLTDSQHMAAMLMSERHIELLAQGITCQHSLRLHKMTKLLKLMSYFLSPSAQNR